LQGCDRGHNTFFSIVNGEFADIETTDTRFTVRLLANFATDIVFSADLCYNDTYEKPRPLGEVAAKTTERGNGENTVCNTNTILKKTE